MSREIVLGLIDLFVLTFVLTSMFGTGLSLHLGQVVRPLKHWPRVALALLASFVVVPLLAYGLGIVLHLDAGLRGGLIILGACAGAPFLPKLTTVAKGDLALAVGLMVLLMVATIFYAPVVLPLLLPGAQVSAWAIARPLLFLMLIPLGIGLGVKAWLPDTAHTLVAPMNHVSTVSLALMAVLGLMVGFKELMAVYGTGIFTAVALLIAGALVAGYLLSGGGPGERAVSALAAGQRNTSAALLVATSFHSAEMILVVLVGSMVGLGLLFLTAGFFGKRAKTAPARPPASAATPPAGAAAAD